MPSSSQLRYAAAYIAITTVVLFFLNIYASNTTRNLIFSAQHRALEEKAQLMTTALLQLDDLSAAKTAQAVNSLEDLRTARTVLVTLCALVPLLPLTQRPAEAAAYVLVAANIAVAVWLCAVLFSVSRRVNAAGDETQPLQN